MNLTAKVPSLVKSFIFRALILFAVWQLCYHFLWEEKRVLDRPLTDVTAFFTAKALSFLYSSSTFVSNEYWATVFINGTKVINIADGCNGLELYVIYIGFICCIVTSLKRMLHFIIGGVTGIFMLNVIRCCSIALLHMYKPSLVDFAHHYFFYLVVYGFIFLLWTKYCSVLSPKEITK